MTAGTGFEYDGVWHPGKLECITSNSTDGRELGTVVGRKVFDCHELVEVSSHPLSVLIPSAVKGLRPTRIR